MEGYATNRHPWIIASFEVMYSIVPKPLKCTYVARHNLFA